MRILCCGVSFPKSVEILSSLLPEHEVRNCDFHQIPEEAREADALIPLMARLSADIINGSKARLIQQFGVGLEGVDLAAANKKGVYVCNIPAHVTPNAQSTAEHAILLMLGAARKVKELATAFHEGIWGAPVGEGIFGSRALIVGYGNVGRSLARKLSGLDLSVDAIKREWGPDDGDPFIEVKARPDQLPDLAARADFVISAASLNESSRHMFNREIFSRMKKTSILINISRGPLVSEKDLIEALEKGEIAGAGLDVFEKEPLESDSPLLKMNNVFATPHVGGVTRQNYQAMGEKVARNISLVAKGETPDYCVNLDSL